MGETKFKADVQKIWLGVLISVIAGIVAAILTPIVSVSSAIGSLAAFAGVKVGWSALGTTGIALIIFNIAVIVGYVLIVLGLGDFKKKVTGEDAKGANWVWLAYILAAVAVLVSIILPFGGLIIKWLINVAAFVLMVLGFYKLKSGSLSENIKKGFNLLFIAQIIMLAAILVGMIPFTGALVAIAKIAALVMVLLGWYKVQANA